MHLTFFAILIILCSIAAYYLIRSLICTMPVKRLTKVGLSILILLLCAGFPTIRACEHSISSPLLATLLLCSGALVCYLVALGLVRNILLLPFVILKKPVDKIRTKGGILVVVLSILFTVIGYHQAYNTKVIEVDVPINSDCTELSNLRVVQLSDLHVTKLTPKAWLEKVVDMTNELKPDLIVVTGDIADLDLPDTEGHMEPLKKLKARYGVYFVDGNHEYYKGQIFQWRHFVNELGFIGLHNEHRTIEHNGARIQIAGIPDSISGHFGAGQAKVDKAVQSNEKHDLSILLSHRSQAVYEAPELPIDLVLAGHTHGGQFFPWNIIVALAQPHIKGLYQEGSRQVHVNQGTGFWAIPCRFGTTSEITLFHFKPQS